MLWYVQGLGRARRAFRRSRNQLAKSAESAEGGLPGGLWPGSCTGQKLLLVIPCRTQDERESLERREMPDQIPGVGIVAVDEKAADMAVFFASHCHKAVSYTHLDVYKRQEKKRLTVDDLLHAFTLSTAEEFANDRILLS